MPPDFDSILADAAAAVAAQRANVPHLREAADLLVATFRAGGKLLSAGNGGSAAEALHLAEELSGRYHLDRPALPGLAICADPTALTCIANDYGFDAVFSRQVEALGKPGDVLALFTTSGHSRNLVRAAEAAKARGMKVLAFTGRGGGDLAPLADVLLDVSGTAAAHVQECHQVFLHALLEHIDAAFSAPPTP